MEVTNWNRSFSSLFLFLPFLFSETSDCVSSIILHLCFNILFWDRSRLVPWWPLYPPDDWQTVAAFLTRTVEPIQNLLSTTWSFIRMRPRWSTNAIHHPGQLILPLVVLLGCRNHKFLSLCGLSDRLPYRKWQEAWNCPDVLHICQLNAYTRQCSLF